MATFAETKSRPRTKVPGLSWTLVRTEGRLPGVVAFEETMVGFFINAADFLGVPKSVAILYGIVFASPEPLSFSEIDARLHLNKGSIGQGIQIPRGWSHSRKRASPSDFFDSTFLKVT